MRLFQTEPLPLVEVDFPSRVKIRKSGYHRTHEVAFLLGSLIVDEGLDDGNAPAPVASLIVVRRRSNPPTCARIADGSGEGEQHPADAHIVVATPDALDAPVAQ